MALFLRGAANVEWQIQSFVRSFEEGDNARHIADLLARIDVDPDRHARSFISTNMATTSERRTFLSRGPWYSLGVQLPCCDLVALDAVRLGMERAHIADEILRNIHRQV